MNNTHKDVFNALCCSKDHIDSLTCIKLAALAQNDTIEPNQLAMIISEATADDCGMNALGLVLYSLQREELELVS